MASGWISVDRCMLESRLFSRSGNHVKICLYLILSANHKPGYVRGVEIARGQCVRSLTQISEACDVTRKTVRCALSNAIKDQFIEIDEPFGAHKGHRISVCNYDTYQSKEDNGAQQGPVKVQLSPTNNNKNNKNNDNKFVPPTHLEAFNYMAEYCENKNIICTKEYCGKMAEKFINHHFQRDWKNGQGKGTKMRSWKRAVGTWIINELDFGNLVRRS